MANNYIDKFNKKGVEYNIHAEYAENANSAQTTQYCENANAIGMVKKHSTTPSGEDDKYREGLLFENTHGEEGLVQGKIELNSKGNLAVESLDGHVNIESVKQIKFKPTTKIIWDSSRKNAAGKGNEFEIEAVNDELDKNSQEKWAELKIKSRNIDLRCNYHGGIALQIAGQDGEDHENKIKFESDRTNSIEEEHGTYAGEGGKGLEFGTFNNRHSSLFTNDYRFNKNGLVFAVTRDPIETTSTGKKDYPTQPDDFKDIINETTKRATWDEIVNVGSKNNEIEDVLKCVYYREEKGNIEITSTAFTKTDSGTGEVVPSSLNLRSDKKVAVKAGGEFEMGSKDIVVPIEISKNNKYSIGNFEQTVENLSELEALLPKLTFRVEKNNSTIPEIASKYPVGDVSISIVDLVNLVNRVNDLEGRIAALENS